METTEGREQNLQDAVRSAIADARAERERLERERVERPTRERELDSVAPPTVDPDRR